MLASVQRSSCRAMRGPSRPCSSPSPSPSPSPSTLMASCSIRIQRRSNSSTANSNSPGTGTGGSFKMDGSLHTFHERKILPYNQRQLYSIVADTNSYRRFLPFVETSRIVSHDGPGEMKDSPWIDGSGAPGDVHKMDHIMKIGFMGFNEEWTSHITCEKYSRVSAYSSPSSLFKTLKTTWTLHPAPSNAPHPSTALPHSSPALSMPGAPDSSFPPSTTASSSTPCTSSANANDPTLVSIDLAYEFANPLYAAAAGAAFQRVSGKIMGAFEKRVREVYGDGTR